MKSKLFPLFCILSALMIVLLAGCGGNETASNGNETASNGNETNSNENEQTESDTAYPTDSVTVIVPYSPGGSSDLTVRAMVEVAEEYLGQALVIENVDGAGGVIGWNELAQSEPDGYTLGLVTTSSNVRPIYGDTNYIYPTEFEAIARVSSNPLILAVHADSPWEDLDDFIDDATENPGNIKHGNSGVGNNSHVVSEMFSQEAGIEMEQVPFDGGSEVMNALLGQHIDATFQTIADVSEHVESGSLRVLGIASEERFDDPLMEDVPTFNEQGVDLNSSSWNGIVAPQGIPGDVKEILVEAFENIIHDEDYQAQADNIGINIDYIGSDEFQAWWREQYEMTERVVTETGIKEQIEEQRN